jgi:hypothetical protein
VLISNGKYYVQSTENKSIKIDDSIIEAYDKLMASASFTDFKQFYSTAFGFYCITMPENLNNSNFLQGTCTCPAYYKHYICKHILGIALRLSAQSPDLCDAKICIPNPANNTSLKGTSRAPGRPPNAPSALKFVHEFVSILEEDANNDVFISDDNETDAAIQAESNQLAAVSQPERVVDIVEPEAIENLLTQQSIRVHHRLNVQPCMHEVGHRPCDEQGRQGPISVLCNIVPRPYDQT